MTGLQSLTHNEFVFVSARYIYVLSVFVDLKQNVFVINGCWINVCWRNISWVVEMDKCKLMLIFYQKSCEPGGACWNGWISHLCKIIWRVAIFHIQALLKLVDLVDSWRLANSFSLANSTFSKYVCHNSWSNEYWMFGEMVMLIYFGQQIWKFSSSEGIYWNGWVNWLICKYLKNLCLQGLFFQNYMCHRCFEDNILLQ